MMVSQSAIKMAPPFSLVSKFFIGAVFYLDIFVTLFPFSVADFNISVMDFSYVGLVHLYLIGFVMMLIVGALFQLVPVVLEVSVYTLKFANGIFWALFVGVGLFVYGMMMGTPNLLHVSASFIYLALCYFSIIYLLSFLHVKEWNLVRVILLSSGICLIAGLSFGFFVLLGFLGNIEIENLTIWVQRHALFTFGGFVYLVILGVSLVLIPMFSLAHNFKDIYTKIAFTAFILALFVSFVNFDLTTFLVSISIFAYIGQCINILALRVRKHKDYWFLNIVAGFIYLVLSVCSVFFDLKLALTLVMLGFLYHFVVGHLYKILPFLVWYKYISPQVGKKKIPMLHEMTDERYAYLQVKLSFFGVLALMIGQIGSFEYLSTFGSILIFLSSVSVLYNVYFAYKFRNY